MGDEKDLTGREQLFCGYLALLGTPFEAARRAGYAKRLCGKTAVKLMSREDIRRQAEHMRAAMRSHWPDMAMAGVARAAFGDATDAVRLAAAGGELPQEELERLDLFAVSELRRRRDGGLDVKLLDRMEALRLLLECTERLGGQDGVDKLLGALDRGAGIAGEAPAERDPGVHGD